MMLQDLKHLIGNLITNTITITMTIIMIIIMIMTIIFSLNMWLQEVEQFSMGGGKEVVKLLVGINYIVKINIIIIIIIISSLLSL